MRPRIVDLYREHGPAVFARCRRLLGEDDAAAEATAEAFVRVARAPAVDRAALAASAENVCLERRPPGRLAVLEDGLPDPAAEERFRRLHLARTLPAIERAERPPIVLRWVWIFGPILVAAAMTGMFFAARSAGAPETRALGIAALEVYAQRAGHAYRVADGGRLRHGEPVRLILVPAGAAFAVVARVAPDGGQVLATLGPLRELRLELAEPLVVGAPGPLHLVAFLSSRPLAPASVAIALERRAAGDAPVALAAVEVSFTAQVE